MHPALYTVYSGRPIALPSLPPLIQAVEAESMEPDELTAAHAALFAGDFERRAQRLELLRQNRDILSLVDRQYRGGEIDSFRYGSRRYHAADARPMLAGIDRQLDEEDRWWADFDWRTFRVHYLMARDLGKEIVWDLRQRYDFQLTLQDIERDASKRRKRLAKVAAYVNESDGPLPYDEFQDVRQELLESYDIFTKGLTRACKLQPPPLNCLPSDQPLGNVLLSEAPVPRLKPVAQTVSGRWIVKLARQIDEVRKNAARILEEGLETLLARLAWVARQWEEQITALPEVEEAEELDESPEERAAQESLLQPLDAEPEFELSEEDVVTEPPEEARTQVELDEEPVEEEFALTDRDVLAEPGQAGEDVEVEDIDPDDHNNRPRHWNV